MSEVPLQVLERDGCAYGIDHGPAEALVFEAHRLCVSLNSRLASNKEDKQRGTGAHTESIMDPPNPAAAGIYAHRDGCAYGVLVI